MDGVEIAEVIDYTPLLLDISAKLEICVAVISGICCFLGVIAGLLLIKILLDRM